MVGDGVVAQSHRIGYRLRHSPVHPPGPGVTPRRPEVHDTDGGLRRRDEPQLCHVAWRQLVVLQVLDDLDQQHQSGLAEHERLQLAPDPEDPSHGQAPVARSSSRS